MQDVILEKAIVSLLSGSQPLASLVGGRIWPLRLDAKLGLPAVIYQRISSDAFYDHGGVTGLELPRVQFSCWAERYLVAKQVATALSGALDGYSGVIDGVRIHGAHRVLDRDDLDAPTGLARVIADYVVPYYRQAVV